MPVSFASLPAHEKQAFFSLLDEYFEARPNLLPTSSDQAPAASSSSFGQRQAVAAVARSQPPPPPTARRSGPSAPEGLSTGKSMGRLDMSSKGAAFGSMIMGKPRPEAPSTAGEAIHPTTHTPASNSARSIPPPPPAPRAPVAAQEPAYGKAEVLYDYNGGEAEDLIVKRFEIVDLIDKISDDWWKAQATDGSGRLGIVPSTYVKQI